MTADIVERLREARHNDHDRGCEGRMYICTCGYDERIFAAAEEAADDIEKLRRENEELDFLLHEGGTWEQQLSAAEAECTRLRAELDRKDEALLYAREKMWEYGFSENDLQPIRRALEQGGSNG